MQYPAMRRYLCLHNITNGIINMVVLKKDTNIVNETLMKLGNTNTDALMMSKMLRTLKDKIKIYNRRW